MKIRYPNITIFFISLIVACILYYLGIFNELFNGLGEYGYVGAFIAGLLFPITFTAPIATAAMFALGSQHDVVTISLLATFGALVGDLGIFTFVKKGTLAEIESIRSEYKIAHRTHDHYRRHKALVELFHSKPFHALALFIGGLMILSPLPDELGVSILASYKIDLKRFLPLSFFLNGIGIFLIVWAGSKII